MATENPPPKGGSEPTRPRAAASAGPSRRSSKPEPKIDRKPPFTLLLRPQSAAIEQHLGLLAFRQAGLPTNAVSEVSSDRVLTSITHLTKTFTTPDSGPPICLLAFQRFDWDALHPAPSRFLGDVVRWAYGQSIPLPTRIFQKSSQEATQPLPPNARTRGFTTSLDETGAQKPEKADAKGQVAARQSEDGESGVLLERQGVWLLIRDVSTAYVVAVDHRTHCVSLLPCPSIRKGIAMGSLDAASTWLPERWFNNQCMALLGRLRELQPPLFQQSLDFDGTD